MSPKKNVKKQKDEAIMVRLTTEQKKLLEEVAAGEGVGLSTWMLQAALIKAQEKRIGRP